MHIKYLSIQKDQNIAVKNKSLRLKTREEKSKNLDENLILT